MKLRKINTHSLQLFSQLLVYCCHPNHQRAVAPPAAPKEHSCSQLHAKAYQHYRKTSFLSTVIKLEKEQTRGLRMRQATKSNYHQGKLNSKVGTDTGTLTKHVWALTNA